MIGSLAPACAASLDAGGPFSLAFASGATPALQAPALQAASEQAATQPQAGPMLVSTTDVLPADVAPIIDAGSTAWMLASSALVLLMVPGLALFYGGMVRRKNVLTTMAQSFVAMAIIGVQWILVGYALTFGKSQGGWIGWNWDLVGLHGLDFHSIYADKGVPEFVFVMFQGKFAIITPALISGAVAERMKFSSYCLFILLWATFVYCPLAHWVWNPDGWLFKMGVLDFAGGTVVHISAGISGLVLALMVGRRRDYRPGLSGEGWAILPHSLPLTLLGAGLLWFGWFGFNAGSAVAIESPVAGFSAGLAFATTQTAAAVAALVWVLIEWRHQGKPTTLGLASGIVAGLVAITPGAGHVKPLHAMIIGAIASIVCYLAVRLKGRLGYDDSLDAFGVHGVGGLAGALLTGVFCFTPVAGLLAGDGGKQLWLQFVGAGAGIAVAVLGTLLLGSIVKLAIGLRAQDDQERDGLDLSLHGERGYHFEIG
ncbi:MAG: ammonium transporter [Planctomycetota bacterium]|nr:ammonium transporter [Planctomycetota bacterium]